MAEKTHEKQRKLDSVGNRFKQAREELGYNIDDLNEHIELSFEELEALEQGRFADVAQQEYIDYYVHSYATLLGLNADEVLADFQQIFHEISPENQIDIHDESQYEAAFSDEAKNTLEALEATNTNSLEPAKTLHEQIDIRSENTPSPSNKKTVPWVELLSVFAFIIVVSVAYYAFSIRPDIAPPEENPKLIIEKPIENTPKKPIEFEEDQTSIPDTNPVKKVGVLEKRIIQKGSTDLNVPTVTSTQKPLILPNTSQLKSSGSIAEALTGDPLKNIINNALGNQTAQTPDDDKITTPVQNLRKSTPLPANELTSATDESKKTTQLPVSDDKYSLQTVKSSWILIEDSSQILFSGELVPGKTITLPKVKDVIISLGDAGVINVYKGQKLIGKLGKSDETLDLVSLEQRLSQITN